jgi:hypothetical protein
MAAPKGHPPYNKGKECGRPTRFTDEEVEAFAQEFLLWLDKEENFWIKDFCLEKNIDPGYMNDWCERSENFRLAYLIGKNKQESKTYKGGLIGKFNSNIVKLALTNHHGWVEKTENKISGDKENPLACIIEKISSRKDDGQEASE